MKPKRKPTPHAYQTNGASRDPCCAKCGREDYERIHRTPRKPGGKNG